MNITEVNITPVKPSSGLVAFASIVVDMNLYLNGVAIYVRLDGSLRLLYPTRKTGTHSINIFHPINRSASKQIEDAIFEKYNELLNEGNHYGYSNSCSGASPAI